MAFLFVVLVFCVDQAEPTHEAGPLPAMQADSGTPLGRVCSDGISCISNATKSETHDEAVRAIREYADNVITWSAVALTALTIIVGLGGAMIMFGSIVIIIVSICLTRWARDDAARESDRAIGVAKEARQESRQLATEVRQSLNYARELLMQAQADAARIRRVKEEAERITRRAEAAAKRSRREREIVQHVVFGNLAAQRDEYDTAIDEFSKALEVEPDLAVAWYNRGVMKAATKDYEGAIQDFNRAIGCKQDLAEAWCNRGYAKAALRLYCDAVTDLEQAIALNPSLAANEFNERLQDLREECEESRRPQSADGQA